MTPNESLTAALSAFAVVLSVVSLRYTRTDRAADERAKQHEADRAHRAQLTTVIAELNRLQLDNAKLWVPHPGQAPASASGLSALLNQQNALHCQQAVDLARRVPSLVSGVEYGMIAAALASLGAFATADQFWKLAVDHTHDPFFAAVARRGYAGFLFYSGEVEPGRQQFQRSLDALPGNGDHNRYTTGVTHLFWAGAEANARAFDRARQQLADAERVFGGIGFVGLRVRADAELSNARQMVRALESGPGTGVPAWAAPGTAAAPHAAVPR